MAHGVYAHIHSFLELADDVVQWILLNWLAYK